MALQITTVTRDGILLAVTALTAILDPAKVWIGVAQAIAAQGPNTTMADVTEATGAMATRLPVTAWLAPHTLSDGSRAVESPQVTFKPLNAAEGQALSHWFLADALTAGQLIAYGAFSPPVVLPDQNHVVRVQAQVLVDPNGKWGTGIVLNG
jgi:hypothetical protein